MNYMIEIFIPVPSGTKSLKKIERRVSIHCGKITYREKDLQKVTLTFEFEKREAAKAAMEDISKDGIHVEGPCKY